MKSLVKKFSNVCAILSLLVLSSCGGNKIKGHSKDIHHVKPPEWVQNTMNDDCFSSVGVSNRKGGLIEAGKHAKDNAVENLKTNIIVKFENLFFEEAKNISDDDKTRLSIEADEKIKSNLKKDNLINISQVYDTWRSPKSDVLYVKVVADKKQVAYIIVDALNELKIMYKNNNTIISLLNKIKNDILYNNFNSSKIDNKVKDKNHDLNGGVMIRNIIISKNSDGSPLSNSTADWTEQDDEIDKKIREAIEISEREERLNRQ